MKLSEMGLLADISAKLQFVAGGLSEAEAEAKVAELRQQEIDELPQETNVIQFSDWQRTKPVDVVWEDGTVIGQVPPDGGA